MITISRSLARMIRPVFRRALLGSSRGPGPAVVLEAGRGGLDIRAKTNQTAIAYQAPGEFPSDRLSVPFQFLADCEGRSKEPVTLTREKGGDVTAQWTDGNIPQLLQYEGVKGGRSRFPQMPEQPGTNDGRLLDALRDAVGTADPTSARYSLGCIQLRGSKGDVAATDGRQLLLQSGFTFPWNDDVLVPANAVFACKELRCDGTVTIGRTDKWVSLQTGPWTIHLSIEKDARFPKVDDHVQAPDAATSRLSVSQSDADFLANAIKRLPGVDEYNQPVTVDLNGSVAVRATTGDDTPPTELLLRGASIDGDAIRFNTNREYLARAIKLGFRDFCLFGPEVPAQARDANRAYVWALLGKDGAIKPREDAIRIESPKSDGQSSGETSSQTERIRKPMTTSKQSTNGQGSTNGNGKPDAAGITTLIEQAEAVKASLSTALNETKLLVAALKKHRQQSKALQSTLASLRQLQTLDV